MRFGKACAALSVGLWAAAAAGCGSVCPQIPQSEKETFLSVRPEEGGYTINAGDQLQIEVWQNNQLTRQVRVRPDGKITLPLVNDVVAAGDTVPQFQKRLTERLKTYLKDPVVSITVTNFSQKQIFIQGQVRTSSAFNYTGDMYLLQAITLAGGTTPFSEGCAVVVRRKGDQFVRYDIELEPVLMGRDLKENIQLQPGDVVTIH
ncbi:MAG: polysaccharide biosynthesis/export family protein [Myxococcales bacterium]|nr:polysaccharide biosynthesis/export family protein [Myxococcales bacterium]MCB9651181.1 polysaccharide biosynthesis/export family protein [Deltaproteobacteria bacterium]